MPLQIFLFYRPKNARIVLKEGLISTLSDIWQGWLQFGVGDSTRWLYIAFDVLLVTVVLTFFLRIFRSKRTISYLALMGAMVGVLVVSAYLTLPALHLLSQAGLILLLAGLPFFLGDEWRSPFTTDSVQPNPYFNTFTAVVLSLVASVLLVGLTSAGIGGKTAELPQGVPLTAVNLPDGMSASFGSQVEARIIVSASRDQWRTLTADNFSATVDVAKQKEGTYDLPVNVASKVSGVRVIRVQPSRVTVSVEPVIKKTVSVVVQFSGKAGNDLVPDEAVLAPNKVEASGPKSVLTDLTQAVIQVRLNGETETINQKFTLVALTADGQTIGTVSFSPVEVTAAIPLVKAGNLKTVGIRPVVSGQPKTGYWVKSIVLSPQTVSVTGTAEALNELKEVTTQPISVVGLSAETTIPITLNLPSGITVTDGAAKIEATISFDILSTTKTVIPQIQYLGLNANLKVTNLNPASISVLIAGSATNLAELAEGSVKLVLDLSSFQSAGTYSVAIKNNDLVLPDGLAVVSYLPSALSVTLENR